MAADDKVVIGQTHGTDDPEAVLIGYLLGVEALRARKCAVPERLANSWSKALGGLESGDAGRGGVQRVRRRSTMALE